MRTTTHTYALLELSEVAYLEISEKLKAAGYSHAFHENPEAPGYPRIDMSGIAVVPEVEMIGTEDSPQF